MSRIETFVSSGEEPIIEGDLDDTVNDCDDNFELEAPKTSRKNRKVYELHKFACKISWTFMKKTKNSRTMMTKCLCQIFLLKQ